MRQLFPSLFRRRPEDVLTSYDIFAAIDRTPLVKDPYPHLVVKDALPRAIADTLLAEMPPLNVLLQDQDPGSNVRFPLPSPLALGATGKPVATRLNRILDMADATWIARRPAARANRLSKRLK